MIHYAFSCTIIIIVIVIFDISFPPIQELLETMGFQPVVLPGWSEVFVEPAEIN